jgi:hypothetical protein
LAARSTLVEAGRPPLSVDLVRRLAFIGFPDDEAAELSALHTRNFM